MSSRHSRDGGPPRDDQHPHARGIRFPRSAVASHPAPGRGGKRCCERCCTPPGPRLKGLSLCRRGARSEASGVAGNLRAGGLETARALFRRSARNVTQPDGLEYKFLDALLVARSELRKLHAHPHLDQLVSDLGPGLHDGSNIVEVEPQSDG